MKNVKAGMKAMMVCLLGLFLSGCGVQRMQMGEREVRDEWSTVLLMADRELDAVSSAGGDKEVATQRAALKAAMGKWQAIPDRQDLETGAAAVHEVEKAVDRWLAKAKRDGANDAESVAQLVNESRVKGMVARCRYAVAAGTYNDIIHLYPAKYMAKMMMQKQAVSFGDVRSMTGPVTEASTLQKLSAAKGG
ncbi:MAG: hypothetical protein E6R08_01040 [Nevskiaceae bacterium]|nr:MAG: hypothetical protein E6R08_01040 [Nevskiaceae bacterium]